MLDPVAPKNLGTTSVQVQRQPDRFQNRGRTASVHEYSSVTLNHKRPRLRIGTFRLYLRSACPQLRNPEPGDAQVGIKCLVTGRPKGKSRPTRHRRSGLDFHYYKHYFATLSSSFCAG